MENLDSFDDNSFTGKSEFIEKSPIKGGKSKPHSILIKNPKVNENLTEKTQNYSLISNSFDTSFDHCKENDNKTTIQIYEEKIRKLESKIKIIFEKNSQVCELNSTLLEEIEFLKKEQQRENENHLKELSEVKKFWNNQVLYFEKFFFYLFLLIFIF